MNNSFPYHQHGATLAISLLLLFITTIIGVSAVQVTSMQEKMSANVQDKVTSFEAAESALKAGEDWVDTLTSNPIPTTTCTSYPCVQTLKDNFSPSSQTSSWWGANSAAYTGSLPDINSAPRYYIEFLRFVSDSPAIGSTQVTGVYYFQVTARGVGNTTNAATILQTTFARRF
jgi:type IV pilus assembly protein PilX